jgi:nicotinamidase-related amidase
MSEKAAIVVLDCQNRIVRGNDAEGLVDRIASTVARARSAGVLVVLVRVGFRVGYPEVSPSNKNFFAMSQKGLLQLGDDDTEIHPKLAPADEDVVVTKHRVGAFGGTDLEQILRSRGIKRLAICGLATSGSVLTTVRVAADLDFQLHVLTDCCKDGDETVNEFLMTKIFPSHATVADSESWFAEISAAEEVAVS